MNAEPIAYRIQDACRAIGCGITKTYELISEGKLDARKIGNRTVVTSESIRAYVAALPKATICMGQRKAS